MEREIDRWMFEMSDLINALSPSEIDELLAPAPRTGHHKSETRLIAMARRELQLRVLAAGVERWNRWSAAITDGLSNAGDQHGSLPWKVLAHVDFSQMHFRDEFDITSAVFPSALSLRGSRFDSYFEAGSVQVVGTLTIAETTFDRDVRLERGQFRGRVQASGARFGGRLEARLCRFSSDAQWDGVHFEASSWFSGSRFERADFSRARFLSDAGFSKSVFGGEAVFAQAIFDDTLGMEACRFAASLDFSNVEFRRGLFFQQAVFAREPVVSGASFERVPVLDGARFPAASDGGEAPAPALREVAAGLR